MQTNDHKIRNYSEVLNHEYGPRGSASRNQFEEEAYAFYSGAIIFEARKKAHLTQSELATRIGADKSYISRIEKGVTIPSVSTFFKIVNALGMSIAIINPL